MPIYPIRLGITLGIIWGFCVLSLAFLANKEYGMPLFHMISQVYVGCSQKDTLSKFICGIMGFIDAFIFGIIIGYLYNFLSIKY